ncbi:MAG: nucleotide exchange factor GrpE [Zavarzinella sp.]
MNENHPDEPLPNHPQDGGADTTEATNTPPEPGNVAQLQERINQLEKQNGEFLQALAEFQNRHNEMTQVMKRSAQDIQHQLKFAHEKFANDLLIPLDNLERAIAAARHSGDNPGLVAGITATMTQLQDVLKRHGITPIEALGKAFDPHYHEAVKAEASADAAPNTVIQVLQQGYLIHEKVMRPAYVVVAQG